MNRLTSFDKLSAHPWLHKAYNKLSSNERQMAREFIVRNDGLAKGAFEFAINRMFIDKPKPKHFAIILELLTCANSAVER